jgi:competence protein ComEA
MLIAFFCAALPATIALATVNVNTAQQSELQSTQGLDRYKAKTIIDYRNQNGPYRSLDDLAKALGEPATEKVASQVTFEGPPFVPPPHEKKSKKKRKHYVLPPPWGRESVTPARRAPASR